MEPLNSLNNTSASNASTNPNQRQTTEFADQYYNSTAIQNFPNDIRSTQQSIQNQNILNKVEDFNDRSDNDENIDGFNVEDNNSGSLNDFNDFSDEATKTPEQLYKEVIISEFKSNPQRALYYCLRRYDKPEEGAIKNLVNSKDKFLYIHHLEFNENFSKQINQFIKVFYPQGCKDSLRNTIIKENGEEVVSFVIGVESEVEYSGLKCFPTDYQISSHMGGLSRVHAVIQGIDFAISDPDYPMTVKDTSNYVSRSGFLIQKSTDFEIDRSTPFKAAGRGLSFEILESNAESIKFEVKLDESKKAHTVFAKDSKAGEWTISEVKKENTNEKDQTESPIKFIDIEIVPYNPDDPESKKRAQDTRSMLGWLIYDKIKHKWLIRNQKGLPSISGLWLQSTNLSGNDFGYKYTLYRNDYLLIDKHLFTITDNHEFTGFV